MTSRSAIASQFCDEVAFLCFIQGLNVAVDHHGGSAGLTKACWGRRFTITQWNTALRSEL